MHGFSVVETIFTCVIASSGYWGFSPLCSRAGSNRFGTAVGALFIATKKLVVFCALLLTSLLLSCFASISPHYEGIHMCSVCWAVCRCICHLVLLGFRGALLNFVCKYSLRLLDCLCTVHVVQLARCGYCHPLVLLLYFPFRHSV